MGNINSPLGNTSFNNASQPRHFSVSDESGGSHQNPQPQQRFASTNPVDFGHEQAPQGFDQGHRPQYSQQPQPQQQNYNQPQGQLNMSPEEVMAYRQNLINERQREFAQSSQNDRKMIEVLVGIGRDFEEVTVETPQGNSVFRLQTLKSKERHHVARAYDYLYKVKNNEALHDIRNVVLSYSLESIDGIPLDRILNIPYNISDEDRYLMRESFIKEMDDNLSLHLFSKFEDLNDRAKNRFSLNSKEGVKEAAEAIKKSE